MIEELKPRTEQHFFSMPRDCEGFLAALAAIQDYYRWLAGRKIQGEATVYCPNPELRFLVPAIEKEGQCRIVDLVASKEHLTLDRFDMAVEFNNEAGYRLSEKTEKSMAQVFGMMVGSEPQKATPDISCVVNGMLPKYDIVVFPFSGSLEVAEFLANNKPELVVIELKAGLNLGWEFALAGRLAVGIRSGMTYLAASAGRAVVEIYPTDRHRNWLSKWSNPLYQMIYGDTASPELVYRAVEAMWKKVAVRERALQVVSK